ncbi:hypothetical protein B0H15DRAFT_35176 [Mycena belliarum]|uniref:Uncharacterized protein n=1 Tax=Mycena belliarum TaxID=1033014 RepID=A0AAD6UFN2_9AGAR|nr:hypothetical protein B0H15DRAFT_35176 [Mycena belliae]
MAALSSFGSGDILIQYASGNWSQIDSGGAYRTRDANATVIFNFNGTLINVLGAIQSDDPAQLSASLLYILDGEDDHSFLPNISSESSTIYSSPDLAQGPHTLTIRLLNDHTTLSVSGGSITTAQPDPDPDLDPDPSPHRRTIAIVAGTIGGSVVLTVLVVALYLFRRRQRHLSPPYALGPLQANLPSSKEAFTSPKYSNHGLSFTHSTESVNVLPRVKAPLPPLPEPYESPTRGKAKKPKRSL